MTQSQKLVEAASENAVRRIQRDYGRAPQKIKPLLAYIEQHLFDPNLDVNQLKRSCGVRDNSVPIQFHAAVGRPPHAYIEDCRMETACRLLADSDMKVWQIAENLGYSSIQVFSRAFSRWAGIRPTAYRKKSRRSKTNGSGPNVVPKAFPERLLRLDHLRKALSGELETDQAGTLIERLVQMYPASRSLAAQGNGHTQRGQATIASAKGIELDLSHDDIERIRAEELWNLIADRTPHEQRGFLRGGVRFKTPALFEVLHARAREIGRDDPERGVELAQLALDSIDVVDFETEPAERNLRARGWIWLANAKRLNTDFQGAEQDLATADRLLSNGGREAAVYGQLLYIKASLKWSQREIDSAFAMISEAVRQFEVSGDRKQIASALVTKGLLYEASGDHKAALSTLDTARRLTEGDDSDPYLSLTIHQNLLINQVQLGDLDAAERCLPRSYELCERLGSEDARVRASWLEGLVAERRGDYRRAKEVWERVRDGFLALNKPWNAALAGLELASLHLSAGLPEEAVRECAAVVPFFKAHGLQRDAVAAIRLLDEAVQQRAITSSVISSARRCLSRGPEGEAWRLI